MGKKYVTSFERLGIRRGELMALRMSVCDALEARFGVVPEAVAQFVKQNENPDELRALLRQAVVCASLDDFLKHLPVAV